MLVFSFVQMPLQGSTQSLVRFPSEDSFIFRKEERLEVGTNTILSSIMHVRQAPQIKCVSFLATGRASRAGRV